MSRIESMKEEIVEMVEDIKRMTHDLDMLCCRLQSEAHMEDCCEEILEFIDEATSEVL